MKKGLFVLILAMYCFSSSPFDVLKEDEYHEEVRLFPLALTIPMSLIPGGMQYIGRKPLPASLFIAGEAALGIIAVNRWQTYHNSFRHLRIAQNDFDLEYNKVLNNMGDLDNLYQSQLSLMQREINTYKYEKLYKSYAVWFTAVHLWNTIDAVSYSGYFKGNENPKPQRAMALSAIPFTGAGQFYNGKPYKAGLMIASTIGAMASAITFQQIANYTEDKQKSLLNNSLYEDIVIGKDSRLEDEYEDAIKKRTMFMWYGIIFYLYGLVDAYTDAHLHNFDKKFNVIVSADEKSTINFALSFKF